MQIRELLKTMISCGASDLYLTSDAPPMYRIEGITQPLGDQKLTPDLLRELADSFMSRTEKLEFGEKLEMTLALAYEGLGRFRVNVFRQRGNVGIVIRQIKSEIMTIDQLQLPPILKNIAMSKRGLALVVGGTGSGKSTSMAAMIDHRNYHSPGHIISVEDPIEFIHNHKKSIVNQREIGLDTHSFKEALRNAMRQAPDVIMVGEIRDTETMEAAITFADTGHLCLGTLHSTNADQSFERILNFFPENRHPQILMQLSLNLRCIISQRLVTTVHGKRVAAMEILMDTPRVKSLIKRGEIDTIKEAMEQGIHEGCQTFDQALFSLYKDGQITIEHALANADSANNLRLKINMEGLKGANAIDQLVKKEKSKPLHIKSV